MKKREIVIFFLVDAMGWEWIKNRPFLDDCVVYKQPVKTIFGFSSAAIPSILTGKYPDEHGRWNLLFYSPEASPFRWTRFLHFLPNFLLENRVTRKLITIITKRMVKADGYFTGYVATDKLCYFDICEKYNIYRPGGISGSTTIIDYLAKSDIAHKVYSYHDYSDAQAFAALRQDLHESCQVYFAYLPELDAFLHLNADKPEAISQKLDWYEDNIRQIRDEAVGLGANVRLFVFSDHGMAPITCHYDLISELRSHRIDLEKDCIAVFDSTMARFWSKSPQVLDKIRNILADCSAGDLLIDKTLKEMRVFFPDGRYGQVIFLMKPGTLIYPNLFGKHKPNGMHGFHPDDAHSYGSFLASVSDYKPESILDLYQVMRCEIDRIGDRQDD
ncbi:MAG: alkaline phosphatase family protein [Proteobacteria bacterium]|nr:alkaline phosphatase family protein [Pseudomonadota bacterium]